MTIQVTPADEACAREIFAQCVDQFDKQADCYALYHGDKAASLIAARVAEAVKGERERALEEAAQRVGPKHPRLASYIRALKGKAAEGGVS